MDFAITPATIGYAIGFIGTIFGVYHYFKNPQLKQEKDGIKLEDRVATLEKTLVEVREKHLVSVENDLKTLNLTLQDLSKTVVRLSTIIDERIPKNNTPQQQK